LEHELTVLKERMQSTPKHLEWDDLPEEEKFERLAPSRKRLTDTVTQVRQLATQNPCFPGSAAESLHYISFQLLICRGRTNPNRCSRIAW